MSPVAAIHVREAAASAAVAEMMQGVVHIDDDELVLIEQAALYLEQARTEWLRTEPDYQRALYLRRAAIQTLQLADRWASQKGAA